MTQIFIENKLFIFGSPTNKSIDYFINCSNTKQTKLLRKNSLDKYSFNSSFMYSINIFSNPLKLEYEVNSQYIHYYPTLCILRNEYVVAIGGFGTKKCEYYIRLSEKNSKKWKELPELPEERFGCNCLCDNTSNNIYVFGGYNPELQKNCVSVFKLNMNNAVKWDTILVMNNSEKLGRQFSCVIKKDNGHWIFIGGNNDDQKATDNIIDININNSRRIEAKDKEYKELISNMVFESLRLGCENLNGDMFIFDGNDTNTVYKINKERMESIKLFNIEN